MLLVGTRTYYAGIRSEFQGIAAPDGSQTAHWTGLLLNGDWNWGMVWSVTTRGCVLSLSLRSYAFLVLLIACWAVSMAPAGAQELHNLEVIFKKSYTSWEPDSIQGFGFNLESAGDVNGDGYDDLAVQGWDYNPVGPASWCSVVFLFYGGSDLDTIPDILLADDYWGGSPGGGVAAGDVNADGFSDIVVGLPYGPGNVDVYFGGDPMDAEVDLVLLEDAPEYYFGYAVATGDINGDGYCDIVASDYYKNDGIGAAYVFYGGPLLDNVPDIALGGNDYEGFGTSLASGGDVNSDGYDDVVVGAWCNSEVYYWGGKVYVYYGGDPMDTLFDVALAGEGPSHHLGWDPVSICREQSTFDCVVAGTRLWPHGFGSIGAGKIYVLFGGDPMDGVPDVCMHGQTDSTRLGPASAAGDVDGDGSDDIIGGAHAEFGRTGSIYLWLGGTDMDTLPDAWMRGDSLFGELGWTVTSAGDMDGDGRDELAFSNYANGHTSIHTVWICRSTGMGIAERDVTDSPDAKGHGIRCQPNPFCGSTLVKLMVNAGARLPEEPSVTVVIHDAAGRIVKRLLLDAPSFQAVWDGRDKDATLVPSGTYFVRLEGLEFPPQKVVLLR